MIDLAIRNNSLPAARVAARPRARRVLIGAAMWTAFAANFGVITWLWLHGGGVSAAHTTGDVLTSIGRITGLLSAYLALVQVLLLARIPWFERLVGFDRLTVWHRRNGGRPSCSSWRTSSSSPSATRRSTRSRCRTRSRVSSGAIRG